MTDTLATLREALRLAVEQRDRAVGVLRDSPDPLARAVADELDAHKGRWVEALVEKDADAPIPPPRRVLSLVPALTKQALEEPGTLRQRVLAAESRLEAVRYLAEQCLPLVAFTLVQATGSKVPTGFPGETYEEARRFLHGLEHRQPHRLSLILTHLDAVAADYPASLGELWRALRAFLKVPDDDPA